MRTVIAVALFAVLVPAVSAKEPPAPDVRVWQGYLFRDGEGRTQIGWPVIAMGVMDRPPHVVGGPLAKKMERFLTRATSSYVFWNYRLEEDKEKWAVLPRTLVRLRGPVSYVSLAPKGTWSSSQGTYTMTAPSLETVEFVGDGWLTHWSTVYRDVRSPFRIRSDDPPKGEKEIGGFAPEALAALLAMLAEPGPDDETRAFVRKTFPETRITDAFRRGVEWDIQRWLLDVKGRYGLALPALSKLDPPPPTLTEIQRWFLDANSRDDFLAETRKRWKGDLGVLVLAHWVERGDSTVYARATLDEVAAWSAEEFLRRQKTSRTVSGR